MHATLYDEAGEHDCTTARRDVDETHRASGTSTRAANDIIGENNLALATNVTSGHWARDLNNERGFFFCFADIRVTHPGRYRLRLSLIRPPQVSCEPTEATQILTYIVTDPFRVHSSKDYPGTEMSTPLTLKLARQIPNIRTRNKNRLKRDHDSDDDDNMSPET
ncbi:hypothetical protein LPJ61_002554 [Coemansia biformis]|uniref:Velvet domain-containing protein n=1 Tax=Coemansia biformis TaxID=1286918 RepID=A0A9W7YFK8_9FUNG|nr:hypothetical protein LPJ61_002554 [Coemansia biformis]